MNSIRKKIVLLLSAMVVLISVSLGIVSCVLNFRSSMEIMEETLTDTSCVAASQVEQALEAKLNVVAEIGAIERLGKDSIPLAEKQALIQQKMQAYGFVDGGVAGKDGKDIFNTALDLSGTPYFEAAMRGETYVNEPIENEAAGGLSILLAAPLWADGQAGTAVAGMVYFVPAQDYLNNLVTSITVGQNGTAYIINSEGTTIAYNDNDIVQSRYNTQQEAKKDPELLPLAALEIRMINGETGFGQYRYGGITKVMAFSPVPGTGGWSITVSAGRNEFLSGVYHSILFTVILIAFYLVAGISVAVLFGTKIAKPVVLCANRLELLAHGDLKSPVPQVQSRDETGTLANATREIVTAMGGIIRDLDRGLAEIAGGNFQVDSTAKDLYIGDYQRIAASMYQLLDRLSHTLSQVRVAADEVASGSGQVSSGAQALSQGATEQASSVEELAATINEISQQVKNTAQHALLARDQTAQASSEVTACNQQMQEMISAMTEISEKSSEIGKIVKTIEDISFQTNILALNAAVEAARAGVAGKGFAVVADEVRNLANKSAEATKNTSVLIEGSIKAVEKGTAIANETAQSLLRVVEGTSTVTGTVDKITDAANEQANSIAQVTLGIDQISSVVQTNSATAEESAAASEELSGQAQMLQDLVMKFHLRTAEASAPYGTASPEAPQALAGSDGSGRP